VPEKKLSEVNWCMGLDGMPVATYSSVYECGPLHKILEAPNVSSTFYIFQELFSAAQDGNSRVLEHITSLWTSESCLTAMKFTVNAKVMEFILLNSLPKTLE